jgi:hypothetical protein
VSGRLVFIAGFTNSAGDLGKVAEKIRLLGSIVQKVTCGIDNNCLHAEQKESK